MGALSHLEDMKNLFEQGDLKLGDFEDLRKQLESGEIKEVNGKKLKMEENIRRVKSHNPKDQYQSSETESVSYVSMFIFVVIALFLLKITSSQFRTKAAGK